MADDLKCVKNIRKQETAVIVELAGEIDLHHTPEVHQALLATCAEKPPRLVINLEQVSYMDSSGIGTLVDVFRKVNEYQGKLSLFGLSERVRNIFEITKLDHFFHIFETEAEALAE